MSLMYLNCSSYYCDSLCNSQMWTLLILGSGVAVGFVDDCLGRG